MDWFLYDNGLRHERVKTFQRSVAFHKETSHLQCNANQMTGSYMKCNTGLNYWVNIFYKVYVKTPFIYVIR